MLIVLAAIVIYGPTIRWLFESWTNDRFYSHGFLVAALSIWLFIKKLPNLRSAEIRPSRWGVPLVASGLLFAVAGAVSDIMTLSGISLVMVAAGMMLACRGENAFRTVTFPIVYFLFAVPVISAASDASGRVLTPMMEFATSATAAFADLIGLHAVRSGTIIRLPGYTMEVVVPCSGMSSVVGLMALAALLAHLSSARPLRSAFLIAAAVPVALAANIVRLTFTALLGVCFGEKIASGFLHELSGIFTFLLGAVLIACIPRGRGSEFGAIESAAVVADMNGDRPAKPKQGRTFAGAEEAEPNLTASNRGTKR